jgi:hypothetical protein
MKTAIILKIKELINQYGIPNFNEEHVDSIFLAGSKDENYVIEAIDLDNVIVTHYIHDIEIEDDEYEIPFEDVSADILGDIFLIMDDYKVSQDKLFNSCKDENY